MRLRSDVPLDQRAILGVLTAVVLSACAPYRVHSDYDHEVSFDAARTFAWMDTSRGRPASDQNPFLERRLRRAVELVMQERGLAARPTARADVLVTAFVIGPTRRALRRQRWSAMACGPSVSVWIGPRYPYGFSPAGPRWIFRSPFWRSPWGYACTYRVGFGYVWLPLYDAPGDRLAGTIVIDILDGQTHELIWRGSAEGALLMDRRAADPSQEDVDTIVRRILADFPPRR